MIRPATAADVPRIVEMGQRFAGTVYAERMAALDVPQTTATVTWLTEDPAERAVFVAEKAGALVGMIALHLFTHPLTAERTASEMFWWVEPEHRGVGLKLLKVARVWAKEAGAVSLQMIAPTPDVELLYARLGFYKVETAYARAL